MTRFCKFCSASKLPVIEAFINKVCYSDKLKRSTRTSNNYNIICTLS